MKYCLNYFNTIKNKTHFDTVEEITVKYDKRDTSFISFLELHPDQRINIFLSREDSNKKIIELINSLIEHNNNLKNENYALKFEEYDEIILEELKEAENKLKYFFNIVAINWDMFLGMAAAGVSDVYIGEDLGFELDKINVIARSKNIQIRTYPNVCQTSWKNTPSLKTFFIRPEDVEIYENYIDVCEFFGNLEKQNIYYDIYKNKQKWYGQLKEMIIEFNSEIDNRYIITKFADKRVRCGKECLKGGKCRMCDRIEELSHTLKENNLIVQIDKKGDEVNNG